MVLNFSKQQFLDLLLLIQSSRQTIQRSDEGEIELKNSDKTLNIKWDANTIDITID